MSSNGGVSSESVRNPSEILPRARVNLRERAASLAYERAKYSHVSLTARTAPMASLEEAQDAEPLELLSEAQKAARDADLDARLEKLKLEVNQEPIHIPHPETVKATEDLLERLAALRQEHAAATATADAFRKSIAKLPEKCSIEAVSYTHLTLPTILLV
mgnify:CR=1 FL=1